MRFIFKNFFSKIIPFSVEKFVGVDRPQMKIHRTRIACWIPYITNTYSECVITMTFPLQQWLNQHASLLRYTYIACLVKKFIDMHYSLIFTEMYFVEDFNERDASCLRCDAKKCVILVPVLRRSLLPQFPCSHSFWPLSK